MRSTSQPEDTLPAARVSILARLVPVISLCLSCTSLCFAATSRGQDLSKFDLSTNDGVNAARETIAGKPLDDHSKACIHRNASLPGMVVVGGFAFDYGCRLQGVFMNSRYLNADDKELSRRALEALGWKAGNQSQREKMAQAWVTNALIAFLTVVSVKDPDFANHSFQPPQAVTRANGIIAVTLWVRLPTGRVRGTRYELREFTFSRDGNFAADTTLENFTATRN